MGLFSKKEVCSVCGEKLSAIGKVKLADGAMCKDCYAKCTQYLSMPQIWTSDDIRRNIEECESNKKLYAEFNPQRMGSNLQVDFAHKLWCACSFGDLKKERGYIFRFSDIVDYEFIEDGKTITKSGVGGAIAGGLLFGGVGMLAGGLAGRKSKEAINRMSVIIRTKNEWMDSVEIPIVTGEIKKGGMSYQLAKTAFEQIIKTIDAMQSRA